MRTTLNVRLVPSKRTDLICVVCGRFRTDAAIAPNASAPNDADAWAGIHRKCMGGAKRRRLPNSATLPGSEAQDGDGRQEAEPQQP